MNKNVNKYCMPRVCLQPSDLNFNWNPFLWANNTVHLKIKL